MCFLPRVTPRVFQSINQSINLYLNTVKSIRNLKIKNNLTILNKIQNQFFVFRCLERLPRILHQFSNLTSNSHYIWFLKLNFGKNKQISFIAARYTRSRPTSPVWFSTFVYSGTLKKPCKFGVKWYPSLLTHCNF